MSRTVTDVSVEGVQKRNTPKKHIVYAIKVTWSDGTVNVIYRTYKQFQILENRLLNVFSDEASSNNGKSRTIPKLQGKERSLTRKSNPERKWEWIDMFTLNLFELPSDISECDIVEKFFTPKPEDLISSKRRKFEEQQEKAKKKKRRKMSHPWKRVSTIKNISSPVLVEEYRVLEDYAQLYDNDMTLAAGTTVLVVKKRDDGWWMVDSGGVVGWAPASYLELVDGTKENRDVEEAEVGEGQMYFSVKPYKGLEVDELRFPVGVNLQVIRKNLDGWWTAIYMGKEGFVPAVYLKPLCEKKQHSKARKTFSLARLSVKSYRKVSRPDGRSGLKLGHVAHTLPNPDPVPPIKPIPRRPQAISFEDDIENDKMAENESNSGRENEESHTEDMTDNKEDKYDYERSLSQSPTSETGQDDITAENGEADDEDDSEDDELFNEDLDSGDILQHNLNGTFETVITPDNESEIMCAAANDSEEKVTLPEETETEIKKTTVEGAVQHGMGKITDGQGQSELETEHELNRCNSDLTQISTEGNVLDKKPKLTRSDRNVTANLLPRSATFFEEREKQRNKGWNPQDLANLNEQFQKRSMLLTRPNSIANLIRGTMPFGALMDVTEGQARETKDVPTVKNPADDQRQNRNETEHVMHRCYSDPAIAATWVRAKNATPHSPLTANSLPRSATVSMMKEKQYHKRGGPQDVENRNLELQKKSESLRQPNSIANLLPGAMPFGTSMDISEGQAHQKKKVLTPVSRPRQISALSSTCRPHIQGDANKSPLPDLETQQLNSHTNDKLNEGIAITADCHDTSLSAPNTTTQGERLRRAFRDTSRGKKRTQGSISKLVVKPKPFDAQVDIDEDRLPKQGSEILNSCEDLSNTKQQVLTGSGHKSQQCPLAPTSYNGYEGHNGYESASLPSDNNNIGSGVNTASSPSTSAPTVLLSNNNTCLLHPSCPEKNYNRREFQSQTYFAIASYEADQDLEVSLFEGEEVKVLRRASNGWWLVKVGDERGWAPSNYLKQNP